MAVAACRFLFVSSDPRSHWLVEQGATADLAEVFNFPLLESIEQTPFVGKRAGSLHNVTHDIEDWLPVAVGPLSGAAPERWWRNWGAFRVRLIIQDRVR
ncbi:hypothetical protein GCM10009634_79940 [Saccharothrix xinjiangensis]